MKHSLQITVALTVLFFVSQVIGLLIINGYIDRETTSKTGTIAWKDLPSVGGVRMDRPDVAPAQSVWYIAGGVLVGSILVLVLMYFGRFLIWKIWFFLAVVLCLYIALSAFLPFSAAALFSIVFGVWKLLRPSVIVHNLTELFIYGGLAAIFVPLLNMFAAIILLILISLYDMFAVWKSKHMVKMAKFQTKSGVFAGLFIPYSFSKGTRFVPTKRLSAKMHTAILGGGDIGFPLLFSGAVMKSFGFFPALAVPVLATVSLFLLLFFAEKKKFYPAMPFLSVGCFIGAGIAYLL